MKKKSILFTIPAFLIYTVLMIVPIIGAFLLSFTDWNGISATYNITGVKNYLDMLSDQRLRNAVFVTLKITVVVAVTVNVLGLLIAMMLNRAGRMTNVFRSIFFLPYVLSTVAISFIWLAILSYTGVFNSLLNMVGLENVVADYIGNANNAIWSICIIEIWRLLGFHMVLYLASIQTVPQSLYEACTMDGGNRWHQFRYVTLPMIAPTTFFLLIIITISSMQAYDQIKVLTNGGPMGATRTLLYYYYTEAFGAFNTGKASAVAVVLVLLTVLLSVVESAVSKLSMENQNA